MEFFGFEVVGQCSSQASFKYLCEDMLYSIEIYETFPEMFLDHYKGLICAELEMQEKPFFFDIVYDDGYFYSIGDFRRSFYFSFPESTFQPWNELVIISKVPVKEAFTISSRNNELQQYPGGVITATTFHKGQSSLKFSQLLITAINNNGGRLSLRNGNFATAAEKVPFQKCVTYLEQFQKFPIQNIHVEAYLGSYQSTAICDREEKARSFPSAVVKSQAYPSLKGKRAGKLVQHTGKYGSSFRETTCMQIKAYYAEDAEMLKLEAPTPTKDPSLDELGENLRSEIFHGSRNRRSTSTPSVHTIESDAPGIVSDEISDPPGQQSFYIPPGDISKEGYRVSTFQHFPLTCMITRSRLAKSGFYFTGYADRVKCFACSRTIQQWRETDDPRDRRWHKSDCPLLNGEESGNVPLPSLFKLPPITVANGEGIARRQSDSQSLNQNQHDEVLEQRYHHTAPACERFGHSSSFPAGVRPNDGPTELRPGNQAVIYNSAGPTNYNQAHRELRTVQQQPRRQWRMANVVSADHKRFLTNLYLNRELDRLASFARWPVGRPNIAPAYLAKSGFFYLGDMDRTQCFSCGGVLRNWKLEDDADTEHRSHFPQCQMMLGIEVRNVPVHEYPETEEERERKYPCRFPSNPHMRSEGSRLSAFDQRWPMRRTAATPAEIAQAGFFFLGERDRAKCWYCNGGLQNWEYDDVPWIEHAKWFPNCQFLLRVKGQHFVYRHLAVSPHLARPIIARQDGSVLENFGQLAQSGHGQVPRSQDIPSSSPRVNQPAMTPVIVDPQEEMRRCKDKVQALLNNSDVVKFVITMGFDSKTVASVLEDRISSGDAANATQIYESASDLLDDVNKKKEELEKEENEWRNQASASLTSSMSPLNTGTNTNFGLASMTSDISPGMGKYNVSYADDDEDVRMDQDLYQSVEGISAASCVTLPKEGNEEKQSPESLRKALEAINEEKLCKICFSNKADMVFVPCSHLCCCMECTQAITQCPICRKPIEKAIRTYLS